MAKVPYSPSPSIDPTTQAVPNLQVNAPGEAFGTGVAHALGEFGGQVSRSGDELFARASAMQELANQNEARDADTQYTIEAGKLHAAYSVLDQQDAVQAFPKYQSDLNSLRDKIKGSLSNPDSQRRYDASTQSTMAQSIFNGADHAAQQNKKWSIGSLATQNDLDVKSVEDNPFDEGLFNDKVARIKANTMQLSDLQGFDPGGAEEQDLTKKELSKLWFNRIVGASRQKPFEAVQMLDANKENLTSEDYIRADTSIRSQARSVGSANIAQKVYSPDKTYDEMDEEARSQAKQLDPNDPVLEKDAVIAMKGLYRDKKYEERQQKYDDQNVVRDGILSGVKDTQELRADPKVAEAMDRLPAGDRLSIPGQINRYNDARDKTTDQDNYNRLHGLANNDVEGFLNTDLTKEKLSQADMRKLIDKQQKIKDEQGGDPRVDRAMKQLRSAMGAQLQALGVYSRTQNNADQFDKLTGTLQSAMDEWVQDKGKPPTYQDMVQDIGPRVIQQRSESSLLGLWHSNRAFFDQDIPNEVADRIKADVVAKGGAEPTDEQVYKAYVRAQYYKLYGPKKDQSRGPSGQ